LPVGSSAISAHGPLVDKAIAQDEIINRTLQLARAEYTVMPCFAFHQPVDYLYETLPPDFGGPPILLTEALGDSAGWHARQLSG
jgi:hypothetical protein